MKKTKIMDINLGFNELSKNFELEIETYNGNNISQGKVTETINLKSINRLIKTIQSVGQDDEVI